MMRKIGALAAACVLVCAGVAMAQTRDRAFEQGIDAYNYNRWTDLVAHMRRALAADAKESLQKIGTRRIPGIE